MADLFAVGATIGFFALTVGLVSAFGRGEAMRRVDGRGVDGRGVEARGGVDDVTGRDALP